MWRSEATPLTFKPKPQAKLPRTPLARIADALELLLKLQLMKLPWPITVAELRAAAYVPADPNAKPVVLNQSAAELAALAGTLPGSAEEADYLLQAESGADLHQRLAALRGQGQSGQ